MATYASKLRQEKGSSKAKLNSSGNIVIETPAGLESTEILGTDAIVTSNITDASVTTAKQNFATAGTAALTGPSPLIWDTAPLFDVQQNPTLGFHVFDDFINYGGLSLAANGTTQGLTLVERTNATLANDPAIPGGVMVLDSTAGAVDTGGSLQMLGLQVEPLTGTTIYMEWRCKVSENGGQCFMGLCDDDTTAAVTSSDGIVTNKNLAGFYRDAGTADAKWSVGVCDGSSSEESDDEVTAVLTTYHKYGIVISGIGAVSGSTVKFYFDGLLVYTTLDTNDLPLLLMCPMFQMDHDASDQVTMRLDWMRVFVHHATGLCREA